MEVVREIFRKTRWKNREKKKKIRVRDYN